jgi:hypothetical protein
LSGYPAPAWSLDVPRWAGGEGSEPVVEAWWMADELPKSVATILHREADRGFKLSREPQVIRPELIASPEDKVVLESVGIEELPVETDPRRPGQLQKVPCLVVRLSFPANKPYLVRPRNKEAADHYFEHRFYSEAQKYTGIFPNWTEQELQSLSLELVSLDAFKKHASKVRFEKLGKPDRQSARPQRVFDLGGEDRP